MVTWSTKPGPLGVFTIGVDKPPASFSVAATDSDSDSGDAVSYKIASGNLPQGLALDGNTGKIAGTPKTPETQTFEVGATSSGQPGLSVKRIFSIRVGQLATKVFVYAGKIQWFKVPAGVTKIKAYLWGAGGGGSRNGHRGGYGGFSRGEMVVKPGETLGIVVGQGGITHSGCPRNRNYRFGGGASGGSCVGYANTFASGGGRSSVYVFLVFVKR